MPSTSGALRRLVYLGSTLLCSSMFLGCVGETGADDEESNESLGEAAQPVSSTDTYWYGSTGGFSDLSLGTDINRTCFLSAVNGKLTGSSTSSTSVNLFRIGAGWWLSGSTSDASANVGAGVVCIGTSTNRTQEIVWHKGEAAKDLGEIDSARRCFLTSVGGVGGFTSSSDEVKVFAVAGHWWIGGTMAGNGFAGATCVDVPTAWSGGETVVSGPFSANLISNGSGGWACALTGVGGTFTTNGWDGPEVTYDAGLLQWKLTSDAGKVGRARCVK